jgi:hypothetical protein
MIFDLLFLICLKNTFRREFLVGFYAFICSLMLDLVFFLGLAMAFFIGLIPSPSPKEKGACI